MFKTVKLIVCCGIALQATGLNKLEGQSGDKQAVSQQLVAVQQQVEQVKGENEELRGFFQEALQVSFHYLMRRQLSLQNLLHCCMWPSSQL